MNEFLYESVALYADELKEHILELMPKDWAL